MNVAQLKERLQTLAPETQADVVDMTGTLDHYQAVVISPAFDGKMMIEQHRMVFRLVQSEIDSGEVHALTLKTYTPEQFRKLK
ncbi:MAG: BolA family protein [Bdellovibrionia bacterium]